LTQIENLRSAIRYLRNENSLLKSKELYHDLHVLPALPYRSSPEPEPAVPELDPSSPLSSPSSSLSDLPVTPTRHSLETEGKLLFREITAFQTRSKIVDISSLRGDQGWISRKRCPEVQVWEWKEEGRRLERKVEGLADRMRRLAVASAGHSGHGGVR
jgi:dynactin 1